MATHTTIDIKEEFIDLRARGFSIRHIAKELDRDTGTILRLEKELKEEVATAKAIQLESLYERYYLVKEAKVSLLGDMITRLKEEIDQRDFSDVPTKDLLLLLGKYLEAIEKEYIPLKLQTEEEIEADKSERQLIEKLVEIND